MSRRMHPVSQQLALRVISAPQRNSLSANHHMGGVHSIEMSGDAGQGYKVLDNKRSARILARQQIRSSPREGVVSRNTRRCCQIQRGYRAYSFGSQIARLVSHMWLIQMPRSKQDLASANRVYSRCHTSDRRVLQFGRISMGQPMQGKLWTQDTGKGIAIFPRRPGQVSKWLGGL